MSAKVNWNVVTVVLWRIETWKDGRERKGKEGCWMTQIVTALTEVYFLHIFYIFFPFSLSSPLFAANVMHLLKQSEIWNRKATCARLSERGKRKKKWISIFQSDILWLLRFHMRSCNFFHWTFFFWRIEGFKCKFKIKTEIQRKFPKEITRAKIVLKF